MLILTRYNGNSHLAITMVRDTSIGELYLAIYYITIDL